MAINRPLVEGPMHASMIRDAQEKVRVLEENRWNFEVMPEVYAKNSKADVLTKEMVHIFDGRRMTRLGRLIMGGVGKAFNLMGPIPADSEIKVSSGNLLDQVNRQLGCGGIMDHPDTHKLGDCIQEIEFYNYSTFHSLREMVQWLIVHDSGCFPSTLAHMVREFSKGKVVQNYMYRPAVLPKDPHQPSIMQGACLAFSFPSSVVEWMDRPLFGGLAKETMHVETLLTADPSAVSHPYLPLVGEGRVEFGHQTWFARRFMGTTPKDGLQGPDSPAESADNCNVVEDLK